MENKQGSGETARALIRQGATDEETLELVRFLHPGGRTTLKTIRSYRSRMRDDFEDVPVGGDAPGIDRARLRELIVGQNHEPSSGRRSRRPPVRTSRRRVSTSGPGGPTSRSSTRSSTRTLTAATRP